MKHPIHWKLKSHPFARMPSPSGAPAIPLPAQSTEAGPRRAAAGGDIDGRIGRHSDNSEEIRE
jgi:hypothetical protein